MLELPNFEPNKNEVGKNDDLESEKGDRVIPDFELSKDGEFPESAYYARVGANYSLVEESELVAKDRRVYVMISGPEDAPQSIVVDENGKVTYEGLSDLN